MPFQKWKLTLIREEMFPEFNFFGDFKKKNDHFILTKRSLDIRSNVFRSVVSPTFTWSMPPNTNLTLPIILNYIPNCVYPAPRNGYNTEFRKDSILEA